MSQLATLRHDPLPWLMAQEGIPAIRARRLLRLDNEGDCEAVSALETALAAQQVSDGSFGESPMRTAGLLNLLDDLDGECSAGVVAKGADHLFSVLGRHAARALETKLVADAMADWVLELKPGEPVYQDYVLPEEASGVGMTDAPRGALGHWCEISDGVLSRYQAVVPTTWNGSPRDDSDVPGPIEQALIGTKVRDPENPFELVRIVRSFDPCLACSIHMVTPKRRRVARAVVL